MHEHIRFSDQQDALLLLDQRRLPQSEEWFVCRSTADVIYALQTMVVRGAPAIGVVAAYGCYLAARQTDPNDPAWPTALRTRLDELAAARPTAVNLRWAVARMREAWADNQDLNLSQLTRAWLAKAKRMHNQDIEINRRLGAFGGALLSDGDTVMTHCNAGALATAGYGTALGVVRGAIEQGKRIAVIANETRPFLQGARLTAYELAKDGIPVRVACDNACGLLMSRGLVHKVVVGADRIAANGDTANKIGTYVVATLAQRHGIPFYVAAPLSTIDPATPDGGGIPIEERPAAEVTHIGGHQITPDGVGVFNFAFDVTPAGLISGIITEKGVLAPPYGESIARLFRDRT